MRNAKNCVTKKTVDFKKKEKDQLESMIIK